MDATMDATEVKTAEIDIIQSLIQKIMGWKRVDAIIYSHPVQTQWMRVNDIENPGQEIALYSEPQEHFVGDKTMYGSPLKRFDPLESLEDTHKLIVMAMRLGYELRVTMTAAFNTVEVWIGEKHLSTAVDESYCWAVCAALMMAEKQGEQAEYHIYELYDVATYTVISRMSITADEAREYNIALLVDGSTARWILAADLTDEYTDGIPSE